MLMLNEDVNKAEIHI